MEDGIKYATYNGHDTVIAFNSEILGETQAISYDDSKKTVEISFVNFCVKTENDDKTPKVSNISKLKNMKNIMIEQLSTCGYLDNSYTYNEVCKRYRRISGANFLYEKSSISVDDLHEKTTYVFSYDRLSEAYDIYDKEVNIKNVAEYMNKYLFLN